jgi:hypothetical protein
VLDVTGLTAIPGNGLVVLQWTPSASTGVTGYTVLVTPQGGPALPLINVTPGSAAGTTVTGLTNGVPYSFTVTTVDSGNNTSPGVTANATPAAAVDTQPPTDVSNLTATPGSTQVMLSWTPATDNVGILNYQLTVSTPPPAAPSTADGATIVQTITLGSSATSTTVTGLTNGTSYRFKLIAKDIAGNLSPGGIGSFVDATPADTQPPTDVSNVVAVPGNGQMALSWTAATDNVFVSGYTLTVSTPPPAAPSTADGTTVVQTIPLSGAATSTMVTGLTNGTTYRFKFIASDPSGNASVGGVGSFVDASPSRAGQPVTGWGSSGVVTSNPSARDEQPFFMAFNGSTAFVGGTDQSPGSNNWQWRIEARSRTSGALSSGFGTSGVVTSNPSTGDDVAFACVVHNGDLFVVGYDESQGLGDLQWRIERRSASTGSLVTGFGTGGVVTSNPSSGGDIPRACVTDGTSLYVAGWDASAGSSDLRWRIEKRSLSNGGLVSGFGTGGVVTVNPSTRVDGVIATAIDASAIYLVGADSTPGTGDEQWRIEKRSLSTGALVTAFGTNGVVTVNPSSSLDEAWSVAIDGSFLYAGGFDHSIGGGDYQWRVEKRSLTTGALDTGFASNGVLTVNPSSGDDTLAEVLVVGTDMYLAGWDESPGWPDYQWRVEKRAAGSGALNAGFGGTGVVVSDPSSGDDSPNGLAVSGTTLYVFGYDDTGGSDWQWRVAALWR